MADESSSYTIQLIIEAVNRADDVVKEVMSRLEELKSQAQAGSEKLGDAGVAVKESFEKSGEGAEKAANAVSLAAGVMGATPQMLQNVASKVKQSQGAFADLKNEVNALPIGLGKLMTGFIGTYAAIFSVDKIIHSLVSTAQEALHKFSDLRLAGLQLEAAWEGAGRKMPIERLREYTAAIAENSLFSKQSIETAAKTISIFPAITDEMVPRVLKVASMMSAFKGGAMGIEEAASLLGRASTGAVGSLSRQGFAISAAAKESKDFEMILGELEKKLGGALPAVMSTWNAQVTLVEKSHSKLKTALGEFLTPALLPAMKAHTQGVDDWAKALKAVLEDKSLKDFQEWIKELAFMFVVAADATKKAVTWWAKFKVAMEGPKEGQEDSWAWKLSRTLWNLTNITPLGMGWDKWREAGRKRMEEYEAGVKEGEKGEPIAPNPIIDDIKEAREESAKFRKEMEGISLLHPEDKQAFTEFFDESDRWLGILEAIQQGLASYTGKAQAAVKIDWDAALARAQEYYAAAGSLQKLQFEEERTLVADSFQSKEQRERALAMLELEHSAKRIAAAQQEYETTRALTAKKYEEEEKAARKRLGNEEDAEEELKKIREKRVTDDAAAQQKMTDTLTQELAARQQALQKVNDQLKDHADKVKDAHASAEKAIRDTVAVSMNEWGKYQAKLTEVREIMARVAENIQVAPAKAIELAQNARGVIQSLAVDVYALQTAFLQFQRSATVEQQEMRKKGKSPAEQAKIDAETYAMKYNEALQAAQSGEYKEGAAAASEARAIAKKLYESAPKGSQQEKIAYEQYQAALELERNIRQEEIAEAKARHDEAIKLQTKNNALIQQAMDEQASQLEQQRAAIQEQINASNELKAAIEANTAAQAAGVSQRQEQSAAPSGSTEGQKTSGESPVPIEKPSGQYTEEEIKENQKRDPGWLPPRPGETATRRRYIPPQPGEPGFEGSVLPDVKSGSGGLFSGFNVSDVGSYLGSSMAGILDHMRSLATEELRHVQETILDRAETGTGRADGTDRSGQAAEKMVVAADKLDGIVDRMGQYIDKFGSTEIDVNATVNGGSRDSVEAWA